MIDPLLSTPYARDLTVEAADPNFLTSHGDSVRVVKAYPDPTCIFMLYIGESSVGVWDVRHMYDAGINPANIDAIEERLFNEARGPGPSPHYIGKGFDGMHWRFPCFFTMALDIPRLKFQWGVAQGDDPMIFRSSKPNLSGPFAANTTFYNGKPPRELTYTDGATLRPYQLFRCVNYLKDAQGHTLDEPRKKNFFSWDIYVVPRAGGMPMGIDPDGTNQGPPGVP